MSPPKKNGGYEAGKLSADIAYIKSGVVDLNEKWDGIEVWMRGVESRLAVGSERFTSLANVDASLAKVDSENALAIQNQSRRVDDVLKEGRITTIVAGVIAAVVGVLFGPRQG